jgi:hypothetical protein
MTVHDGIDTGRPVRLALGSRAAGLTLGAALLTTGLMAGVYYDWAVSVMPGLARTDDRTFVYVMQEITEAIQNPVFFLGFFGAPLLTLGALLLERRSGAQQAVRWIWAALGLNVLASSSRSRSTCHSTTSSSAPATRTRSAILPPSATASKTPGSPGTSSAPSWQPRRSPASGGRSSSTAVPLQHE